MRPFTIFAIVFSAILLLYYIVMIALDYRNQGKKPSQHHEEFDVSGMQDEEKPRSIEEAKVEAAAHRTEQTDGYSLPEPQIAEQTEPQAQDLAEQKIRQVEESFTPVRVNGIAELPIEDYTTLMLDAQNKGSKFGIVSTA